jgi:signal transduction histidine kinase
MNRLRRRAALGHSARVAAVATALIAVVYVVVIAALDSVIFGRLARQADQNLAVVLKAARTEPLTSAESGRRLHNLDDAPILLWKVNARGQATPLTAGSPSLPARRWPTAAPVTASLDGGSFRLEASPESQGWLVAGQSLAGSDRVRTDLLVTEAILTPFLLLAVYLGSFTIGLRASAPVERVRRRQLEFTADASHELRTPLSVIEAEAELALSAPRSATGYRAALSQVINECQRLRRIVEDLLWLARFDSEPPPPGHEPVDLALIAARCAERFRAVADARGISLTLRHDQTGPALVTAPAEWIDRLLGVLVDNACRYCCPGGTVAITTRAAGSRACIVVEDNGPGIPDHQRERLFDRFHRGTTQPGGAGLGLAIADAIVCSTSGRWTIARSPAGGAHMQVSWHRPAAAHDLDHPDAAKASQYSQDDR